MTKFLRFALVKAEKVRCKFWYWCGEEFCRHYHPHEVEGRCVFLSPVKFCKSVNGFVHDIPYSKAPIEECDPEQDPNFIFKYRRKENE